MEIPKVDFIIAGSQKAATSSLLYYLKQHPEVFTHKTPEFAYFCFDFSYNGGYELAYKEYFNTQEYKQEQLVAAKTVDLMYDAQGLKRLKEHNPNIQIAVVLREPIARAYSAYWYARKVGTETSNTFEEAIFSDRTVQKKHTHRNHHYIEYGMYAKHIKNIYQYFSKDQVEIILLEELKKDPQAILNRLVEKIGITKPFQFDISTKVNSAGKPRFEFIAQMLAPGKRLKVGRIIPKSFRIKIRQTLKKANVVPFEIPEMNQETKKRLKDIFKDSILELEELIGKDLTSWK